MQLETCLEIANIKLCPEDLDIMLQSIGLDDDGKVSELSLRFLMQHAIANFVTFYLR
jgi:hypothetical protein